MAANMSADSSLVSDMRQQEEDARKMRHLMATGATEVRKQVGTPSKKKSVCNNVLNKGGTSYRVRHFVLGRQCLELRIWRQLLQLWRQL